MLSGNMLWDYYYYYYLTLNILKHLVELFFYFYTFYLVPNWLLTVVRDSPSSLRLRCFHIYLKETRENHQTLPFMYLSTSFFSRFLLMQEAVLPESQTEHLILFCRAVTPLHPSCLPMGTKRRSGQSSDGDGPLVGLRAYVSPCCSCLTAAGSSSFCGGDTVSVASRPLRSSRRASCCRELSGRAQRHAGVNVLQRRVLL